MRLKAAKVEPGHQQCASSVAWSAAGELFSAGDDGRIVAWNASGEEGKDLTTVGEGLHPLSMDWCPSRGRSGADVLAVATAEGKLLLVSRAGRVEKRVDAHQGAVTCVRWAADGSAILTVGEEGAAKIWSKNGMLRSGLTQAGCPIHAASWCESNGGQAAVVAAGKELVIQPLQAGSKTERWQAHESVVLAVDYSRSSARIISGGEDCKYKVWDAFGRLLYASGEQPHPITSLRWAPDGSVFAVGSHNTLRLCDVAGWSHTLQRFSGAGSLYDVAWTEDSTRLAAACAGGQLVVAHVLEKRLEDGGLEVILTEEDGVTVKNVATGMVDTLDFRDRVVKMALGHGHIVVATITQCHCYKTDRLSTATASFDLRGMPVSLAVAPNALLLVDSQLGLQVHNFDGKLLCAPKLQNQQVELFSQDTTALSDDTLLAIDHRDQKLLRVVDVQSGKPIGNGISHSVQLVAVAISCFGPTLDRLCAVVDKNHDVFIAQVRRSQPIFRQLCSSVSGVPRFHPESNALACLQDAVLSIWHYPATVLVDQELSDVARSRFLDLDLGKSPQLVSFSAAQCAIRRADGATVIAGVSAHPLLLASYVSKGKWQDAVRLCRFVKDRMCWGCLAAMATASQQLEAATVAYAALEQVDKVMYLTKIKEIPSAEGRSAEIALFCRKPDEAEGILVKAGLLYRAIDMNCRLHRWDRALKLAVKHKTHVDTVLGRRQQFLSRRERKENIPLFKQYSEQVDVDWEKIRAKVEADMEAERSRPGAKPYTATEFR